jgi:hypothetical protein
LAGPTEDQLNNIENGGVCSAFEIIDELKVAFEHDRQLIDRLLSTLKPDCLISSKSKLSFKNAVKTVIAPKFANVVN